MKSKDAEELSLENGLWPMEFKLNETKILIIQGDITEQHTDAVVNAANTTLMGGGGVDGAIHRRGGPQILEECRRIRKKEWPDGLPTGEAVITTGGNLGARHVIHTVGPIWRGGSREEKKLLEKAYQNSLLLAVSKGLRTISFPSISTGAYRYPKEEASRIALATVKKFLEANSSLREIVFVLFAQNDLKIYERTAKEILCAQ